MEHRVKHMVIFNLKHEKGSKEAEKFLSDGRKFLTKIPVVENFEVFNQVSNKNDYNYGFSMEFKNQLDYQTYNEHPYHTDFVNNRWLVEVTTFLEIDFQVYE